MSGLPRQETGSWLERLVIPLAHFLLLGYLPMFAMRWFRHPAFGAGCGQLFLARKSAYQAAGGHDAIRSSRHDGLMLPRAFRRAGLRTDLCDATDGVSPELAERRQDLRVPAGEKIRRIEAVVRALADRRQAAPLEACARLLPPVKAE